MQISGDGELAKIANEVIKGYAISEGLYQPAADTPRSRRGKRKIDIEGIEIDLLAIFQLPGGCTG